MNITFDIWEKTVKTVFSWKIWKKLIIISAIPIVLNAILFQFLTGDFVTMIDTVEETLNSPSVAEGNFTVFEIFQMSGLNTLMIVQLFLAVLFSIEIAILIVATLHITTRESFKEAENSVTQNLFEKASNLFVPFHFYLARVIWYVAWPLLGGLTVLIVSDTVGIPVLPIVAPIVGGVVTFYRTFRSAFSIPFYFEFERETRKDVFEKSLTFSQGKAFKIFLSLFGVGLIIGLASMVIMILVLAVFPMDSASVEESFSGIMNVVMSVPSILFGGIQTVFFYVMYKMMLVESGKVSI